MRSATKPLALTSSTNAARYGDASIVATTRRAHRLLHGREAPVEHAGARQPLGVLEQRRAQAGEGIEARLDEQLVRAAQLLRPDELGVAQVALEPQVVRGRGADAMRRPGWSTSSTVVIGDPGGTRYVHSISQYAAVKAMCSARAGSAPMLPMSQTSCAASSARSPGDR